MYTKWNTGNSTNHYGTLKPDHWASTYTSVRLKTYRLVTTKKSVHSAQNILLAFRTHLWPKKIYNGLSNWAHWHDWFPAVHLEPTQWCVQYTIVLSYRIWSCNHYTTVSLNRILWFELENSFLGSKFTIDWFSKISRGFIRYIQYSTLLTIPKISFLSQFQTFLTMDFQIISLISFGKIKCYWKHSGAQCWPNSKFVVLFQ